MFHRQEIGQIDEGGLLQDPVLELVGVLNFMRSTGQVIDQQTLIERAEGLIESHFMYLPPGFSVAELVLATNSLQVLPAHNHRIL